MLYTGDDIEGKTQNCWAIDATPVEINKRLYLIWSGWPDGRDIQFLYIARMENPWTVATSRVRLCTNDTYLWSAPANRWPAAASTKARGPRPQRQSLHRVFL